MITTLTATTTGLAQPALWQYLGTFIAYTLFAIGLIYGGFLYLKKNPRLLALLTSQPLPGTVKGQSIPLSIETTLPLEPRKALYIIRSGEERFLIATSAESTHLLAKLEQPNLSAPLQQPIKQLQIQPSPIAFLNVQSMQTETAQPMPVPIPTLTQAALEKLPMENSLTENLAPHVCHPETADSDNALGAPENKNTFASNPLALGPSSVNAPINGLQLTGALHLLLKTIPEQAKACFSRLHGQFEKYGSIHDKPLL